MYAPVPLPGPRKASTAQNSRAEIANPSIWARAQSPLARWISLQPSKIVGYRFFDLVFRKIGEALPCGASLPLNTTCVWSWCEQLTVGRISIRLMDGILMMAEIAMRQALAHDRRSNEKRRQKSLRGTGSVTCE
jgi:hypothetical protein